MYQSQSGGVVDTLNKLLEDAQTQLGEASAEETAGIQAFEMLKQHLEGEIKFANKEMGEAKQSMSASEENQTISFFFFSSISFVLFRQLLLLQILKSRILCKSGDARREHERFSKVANIVIPLEGLDYCD